MKTFTMFAKKLVLLLAVFLCPTIQIVAQEVDDLQEYLDKLASEQTVQKSSSVKKAARYVSVPVGLTEVDLSKFTSYQSRTKELTIRASVKFTNGTITAATGYTGGVCLLKVYDGATVVLDSSAGVNAGAVSTANCMAAVGIYDGSTFYQCGDITAPDSGTGIAIYIDGADDTYAYVSGTRNGSISNDKNGTIEGLDEGDPEPYAVVNTDGTTLSFYYDTKMGNRQGKIYTKDKFRTTADDSWGEFRSSINTVIFDVSFADYDGVTSTKYWFNHCSSLKTINGLTYLNTSNVTDMMSMFGWCSSLTAIDLNNFDTHKVINMYGMFSYCSSLTSLDLSSFDTKNVTLMESMFSGCSGLTSLDVSAINTEGARDMSDMFYKCSGLQSLDVSGFDMKNATDIEGMFSECSNLTNLNLGNLNTEKVTNMGYLFVNCSGLTNLDLSGLNTKSATTMYNMFYGCTGLKSLDLSNFNTENLTSMGNMFKGCTNLTSLDVSNFNTEKVKYLTGMFQNCNSLTTIDLSGWNTQNVTSTDAYYTGNDNGMFSGCSHLVTIYVGQGWDMSKVTNSSRMFKECTSLVGGDGTKFNSGYIDKTKAYAGDGGYMTMAGQETYSYDQLSGMLNTIGTNLTTLYNKYNNANATYQSIASYLPEATKTTIDEKLAEMLTGLNALSAQRTALVNQLESASSSSYATLNTQITALANAVSTFGDNVDDYIDEVTEDAKAGAASDLQTKLTAMGNQLVELQQTMSGLSTRRTAITAQIGEGYFLYQTTTDYNAELTTLSTSLGTASSGLQTLVSGYNTLINGSTITNLSDIVAIYQQYGELVTQQETVSTNLEECSTAMTAAETDLQTLVFSFPDESLFYAIQPKDISTAIQMGYKSNRGFVLTSAGLMQFEQKEGADFYLKDNEGNYVVATSGKTSLTTDDKSKATVWTGTNLRNGSYTFHSATTSSYLGFSGVTVNSPVIAGTSAYAWTIAESDLDELQAFLNLLAEEEEDENSGESTLTETDTLTVYVPIVTCDCNHNPIVFPRVPHPVRWRGRTGHRFVPVPRPSSGNPDADFHPIHIPEGSHVVLDEVDFNEIIGGHHILYVEGTVEITVNVTIYIELWDWFIKVGPKGRVIWHSQPSTGCSPKVLNEGTMDVEEGEIGRVDNSGTVNHRKGTIVSVVNRKTYNFSGGIVNRCYNFGTYTHSGGNVLTARNFEGATYTMTGGTINNTTVTVTDTVFVNCGRFYFRGGWMRGYGSRMIYHKKGAYMWIDGGQFDFTNIHDYFIEAWDDFYIRGDHNYNSPVPMLINPSVTIRILYNWIYKFKIVFINGCPTPRYPLFYGYDFDLSSDFFQFIDWQLPNKRWRWYYKAEDNTIEPRDEEVHDEDDLQAYLDWLAENQDGESASTEAEPQELELSKREVVVTQPVTLPVGSHVFFYDGGFSPKTTWTNDWMFRVPVNSSMRVENFVFNYSSSAHYLSGSKPSMRRFFDIFGNIYFGPGCHLRGYYNSSYSSTDDYIPGSVIYMDPSSRVRLGGARFDNVVFRLNTVVNIYVTVRLTYNIYIYVPVGCRYNGFRLMAPEQGFQFNQSDLENIKLVDLNGWDVSIDDDGYVVLQERVYVTPDITLDESVNNSSTLSTYNGSLVNATLVRKLQPGGWNTFSVPFAIDEETLTEKFGEGTEVKQLNGSELDGTTLTLNFSDVSEIEAGVPYLVRVPDVVENPVFEGVTVYSSTSNSTSSYVDFVPVVNPVTLKGGDKSVLFVTGGNSLAYPSSTNTMKGFRAYFKLHEEMANVRAFTMSFDGFETGISDDVKSQKLNGDGAVYDLSGRRVEKPRKGMYIENGRKVIVK